MPEQPDGGAAEGPGAGADEEPVAEDEPAAEEPAAGKKTVDTVSLVGQKLWNTHRSTLLATASTAQDTAVARKQLSRAGRREFEHKWIARAAFQASNIGTCGSLNLLSSKVTDDAVERLARVLGTSKLKVINLTFNEISDRGAGLLAIGLRKNHTVVELSLANNKIGDRGARLMAEAFTDDKDLQILNLAGNKINNPGAKALGRCIEKNMTLAELCLDSNMIGHEGWEALNLGMNRNKDGAISFVSLAGNTGCSGVMIKEENAADNMPGMQRVAWHS